MRKAMTDARAVAERIVNEAFHQFDGVEGRGLDYSLAGERALVDRIVAALADAECPREHEGLERAMMKAMNHQRALPDPGLGQDVAALCFGYERMLDRAEAEVSKLAPTVLALEEEQERLRAEVTRLREFVEEEAGLDCREYDKIAERLAASQAGRGLFVRDDFGQPHPAAVSEWAAALADAERRVEALNRQHYSSALGPCMVHQEPLPGCVRCIVTRCERAEAQVAQLREGPFQIWLVLRGSSTVYAVHESRGEAEADVSNRGGPAIGYYLESWNVQRAALRGEGTP